MSTQWDSGAANAAHTAGLEQEIPIDPAAARSLRVVVVGAGAFGGWTAWHLVRAGVDVTLVDAWGPGNTRSSSGGATRAIRGVYGGDGVYTAWTSKALRLWRSFEAEWEETFFRRTGVLWMVSGDDRYVRSSLPHLREAGLSFDEMDTGDAARQYRQINFDGVEWVLLERDAGLLYAHHACRVVRDRVVAGGGQYLRGSVTSEDNQFSAGGVSQLTLSDGMTLTADRFVLACGPWLGTLLPDVVGDRIAPSRQEVFYLGTPPGDLRFGANHLPVWIDFRSPLYYGFPTTRSQGFKLADDTRGAALDPTGVDRTADPDAVRRAREYVAYRFPALADAPLLDAEVCQYANTPDGHFIVDRHPTADNVWIVGGGSGHGFKLGPTVGEYAARLLIADREPAPLFSLQRFGER